MLATLPKTKTSMAASTSLSLHPCAGLRPSKVTRDILSKNPSSHCSNLHSVKRTHQLLPLLSIRRHSLSLARAVSVGSDQLNSTPTPGPEKLKKYHFLVANAKFMFDEEEHFMELMFERLRNFGERNREQDFWLVIEPEFLDKFPNVTKRLKRPAVALVSTDANWITFMKLRLDRVLAESFESDNFAQAMSSNPVNLQFEKPDKWVAPYPKYEFGWWESFLPKVTSKTEA